MRKSLLSIVFVTVLASASYGQWTFLGSATASATDFAAHGGVLIYTGSGDTHVSADAGATWEQVGGDAKSVTWCGDGFFVGNNTSENFKTDPTGHNWKNRGYISYSINRVYFDTTNGLLYAACMRSGAILRSTDTGGVPSKNTWLPIGGGAQDNTFVQAQGNRIISYYNGFGGQHNYTLDGETMPYPTWNGKGWPNGYAVGAFIAQNGDFYITSNVGPAGFSKSTLWRSRDNGTTWDSVLGGISPPTLLTANIIYTEGKRIIVSGRKQLWFSDDDGSTWKNMNEGLTANSSTLQLVIDGGYVYILVDGSGIYKRPMSDFGFTGMRAVKRQTPTKKSMLRIVSQGNALSSVEVSMQHSSHLRLSIVDILGREVAVLFNDKTTEGQHQFLLPNLHTAQYIIKAETEGTVQTVSVLF